jgi:hypothetical protein
MPAPLMPALFMPAPFCPSATNVHVVDSLRRLVPSRAVAYNHPGRLLARSPSALPCHANQT